MSKRCAEPEAAPDMFWAGGARRPGTPQWIPSGLHGLAGGIGGRGSDSGDSANLRTWIHSQLLLDKIRFVAGPKTAS